MERSSQPVELALDGVLEAGYRGERRGLVAPRLGDLAVGGHRGDYFADLRLDCRRGVGVARDRLPIRADRGPETGELTLQRVDRLVRRLLLGLQGRGVGNLGEVRLRGQEVRRGQEPAVDERL